MRWVILTSVDTVSVYVNLNEVALMHDRAGITRIFFNSVAGATSPSYFFIDVTETPDQVLAATPVVLP